MLSSIVQVNAPSLYFSDMTDVLDEAQRKELELRIPAGKIGKPDDIAEAVHHVPRLKQPKRTNCMRFHVNASITLNKILTGKNSSMLSVKARKKVRALIALTGSVNKVAAKILTKTLFRFARVLHVEDALGYERDDEEGTKTIQKEFALSIMSRPELEQRNRCFRPGS